MLNLNGAIDDRFEEEIDRAVESLKMGYLDKSYLVKGNKILQAAYDKYFERTKDSFLKAKCLRNLSKVCGLLNNNKKEREYSSELFRLITYEDKEFKNNETLYYCLSMNEYSQTFKDELSKEELLKIEEFNLSFYKTDINIYFYDAMMAQSNIYLLKEEYKEIVNLLKDIHTSDHNEAREIENEILHDLATADDFYYRQAKDLINQSSSLQVM